MNNNKIFLISICLIVVFLSGCAEVQPWQRGNLAKPGMALDPSPAQSFFRSHNYGSREAAKPSGASGSGGGCGCY